MSGSEPAHPGAEQLSAFGLGQLDPAASAEVERHVADCTTCCHLLSTLPDDRLVTLLRSAFHAPTEATTAAVGGGQAVAPGIPAELIDHPRYRVVEVLGAGGMGVVYKAEHRLMARPVALKVIDRCLTRNPAAVERFRREVRAAARLSHPNIVHAYDAEQAGDSHFLVMEHVEGTTLARLVEQEGPLPVARACDYVGQTALGLQRAWEDGMVHRDIKPQNLMRTPKGQVKILDFGLARLAGEAAQPSSLPAEGAAEAAQPALTQVGQLMGTPDYMAPEQATDPHAADVRADIYSLGCTLYFLLTGRPPFPDGSALDKVMAHVERAPRPLTEHRPDVPAALARVVERMMARDPARRYRTPAEVAAALRPFAAPPRRRLWIAAAALLLIAVPLAAAAVAVKGLVGALREPVVLKRFSPEDRPISRDGVTAEEQGWRIEAKAPQTVRLFEVADPGVDDCQVIYRARMKSEKLQGQAYLEMWCRLPGEGEFFSRGLLNPVSGTTDWASCETPFFLKKGERPDLIKLNVVLEGSGTLWIQDVSLWSTAPPK